MQILIELYRKLLNRTNLDFVRSIYNVIHWEQRLVGIMGARGIGKTTLVIQFLKKNFLGRENESLYVSLDHIWFSQHSILELADDFVKTGGKTLVVDEVHKYPNWSQELKNIYDFYPELQIIFTGSSLLEILNSRADLSRRALVYHLPGLSFREYLELETGNQFPIFSLEKILESHIDLSSSILPFVRPLKYFQDYLQKGYYPFYREFDDLFHHQLRAIVNLILEIELPQLRKFDVGYINKIKLLLAIVADSVPFIPNVSKLSQKMGINRTTLLTYFHYLAESKLTTNLYRENEGISLLQKPEKLYLENCNLIFALGQQVNEGNLRETFFLNQISYLNDVRLPEKHDFLVNKKFIFEIGGKNKSLPAVENNQLYVASDGIEVGFNNKIPLWLFGFLY